MTDLNSIRKHIITELTLSLPYSYTYHTINHTLDVEAQCVIIAFEEGITDEQSLLQLRIAALYHDYGMIIIYKGHEEKSCELAKKQLPKFGVNERAIENICQIILATKVPQLPKNHLQQIICDADLDYLGRDDYFIINENLKNEFKAHGIISDKDDWEASRIEFLKSHTYFTKYSQQARNSKKHLHLKHLLTIEEKKDTSK